MTTMHITFDESLTGKQVVKFLNGLADQITKRGKTLSFMDNNMINKFEGEYGFLCNFGQGPINYQGKTYPTAEHLYQSLKTLNTEEQELIRIATTPGKAKRLGKTITRRKDWDEAKDDIMRLVLNLKFTQNPDLMVKLLATGDRELIEGNDWGDVYWGVCNGVGKNKLGILLQELRTSKTNERGEPRMTAAEMLTELDEICSADHPVYQVRYDKELEALAAWEAETLEEGVREAMAVAWSDAFLQANPKWIEEKIQEALANLKTKQMKTPIEVNEVKKLTI